MAYDARVHLHQLAVDVAVFLEQLNNCRGTSSFSDNVNNIVKLNLAIMFRQNEIVNQYKIMFCKAKLVSYVNQDILPGI